MSEAYVVAGAKLKCSCGNQECTFQPSDRGITVDEKIQGTNMDYQPQNIAGFGMCKSMSNPAVAAATASNFGVLQQMPCQPVLSPWVNGKTNRTVAGLPAVVDSSQVLCAYAGVIKVVDCGQDLENNGGKKYQDRNSVREASKQPSPAMAKQQQLAKTSKQAGDQHDAALPRDTE